jgi:glycerophosphoryl diester phosphodiesterase
LNQGREFPLIIAHRGASGYAPENTISAFKKALEMQAEMIELDIRPTADNKAVVYHDRLLIRTTGIKGRVGKLNEAQLTALSAAYKFAVPGFENQKIPALPEVLDFLHGRCRLLLEIKAEGLRTTGAFLTYVGNLLEEYEGSKWIVIQSFDSHLLKRFHHLFPNYQIHKLLVFRLPVFNVQLDRSLKVEDALKQPIYKAINVDHRFITPRFIRKVHKFGKEVYCWTANDRMRMQKLAEWGVDGIITNYPDRLLKLKQEYLGAKKIQ